MEDPAIFKVIHLISGIDVAEKFLCFLAAVFTRDGELYGLARHQPTRDVRDAENWSRVRRANTVLFLENYVGLFDTTCKLTHQIRLFLNYIICLRYMVWVLLYRN